VHPAAHELIEHPFLKAFFGLPFVSPAAAPDKQRPDPESYAEAGERVLCPQRAEKGEGGNEAGRDKIECVFHGIFNT